MIPKILVATDGSKTAKKAARYVIDLAKKLQAPAIVPSVGRLVEEIMKEAKKSKAGLLVHGFSWKEHLKDNIRSQSWW